MGTNYHRLLDHLYWFQKFTIKLFDPRVSCGYESPSSIGNRPSIFSHKWKYFFWVSGARHPYPCLFYHLEEATRIFLADSTVTQYKKKRDGRAARKAIMSLHFATGDWEDEIARINLIISETVWKGTGIITLTMHYNTHRDMNGLARTCGVHIPDNNFLRSNKPYIITLNQFPLPIRKFLRPCQWFALILVYEKVWQDCSLADPCWSQ